jgi:thiol:disulfide interchange protein DsbA
MQLRQLLTVTLLLISASAADAQMLWREGVHYNVLPTPTRAGAPADKIEVAEVFSYGCPYCDQAKENVAKLAKSLPADAAMTYVHASFAPSEAWPMFQRAYYTAQKLGIAEAVHEAVFDAVWRTGEIPLLDKATGKIRRPLPTIEDAAKFYARLGLVKQPEFLKVASSPEIDAAMKRADELVKLWKVPGTPCLVVNGRYIVNNEQSFADQAKVVQFLITLERTRTGKK